MLSLKHALLKLYLMFVDITVSYDKIQKNNKIGTVQLEYCDESDMVRTIDYTVYSSERVVSFVGMLLLGKTYYLQYRLLDSPEVMCLKLQKIPNFLCSDKYIAKFLVHYHVEYYL